MSKEKKDTKQSAKKSCVQCTRQGTRKSGDVFYFSVTDNLEEALAINSVEVLVDGEVMDVEDIIFGRLVVVPFADMDELAGKEEIHIQIRARILEDADLTMYENEEVPNTATLQVTKNGGNEETLESETVYVTPLHPRIVKRVEGQEESQQQEERPSLTPYRRTADRANLVSYEITDTLEEGLRYIDAKRSLATQSMMPKSPWKIIP